MLKRSRDGQICYAAANEKRDVFSGFTETSAEYSLEE
jgi:hypothetical protein